MTENIHGIVLRVIKYSDSTSIATVWTVERGRMSVTVPAGSGREARRRKALMMPLCAFEAVAIIKASHDIARISDVKPLIVSTSITTNPSKMVVAMFLADFLYAVLKEGMGDQLLGQYLFESIEELNRLRPAAVSNYHLMFLYRLGRYLGIEPDMGTYGEGKVFDMREARFVMRAAPGSMRGVLDVARSRAVRTLSRLSPRSLHLMRMTRSERNEALDLILEYYTMHYAAVTSLPSLPILREVCG